MEIDLLKSILHLLPDAQFSLLGNDLSGLTWLDNRPIPTLEQLEAAQVELNNVIPKSWDLLVQKLLSSQVYMKAYGLSKGSLSIAQAFNKTEQVLLVTRIEAALEYFLNDLLTEMGSNTTAEDLAEVNQALQESGFAIQLGG